LPVALALLGFAAGLGLLALLRLLLQTQRQLAALHDRIGQLASAAAQQRAWLARQRRAADLRHRALVTLVETRQQAAGASLRQLGEQLSRRQRDQTREVEALLQLFAGFEPRAPMPSSGHWALNPTELLELWSALAQRRPALVLELGGGTSSVWLGYGVERYGGRLVSIDHDPAYAEQTRAQLRRHGLDKLAEVRVAELQPVTVDDEPFQWYGRAAFAGVAGVELLLVDGPPGTTGRQARYPALPLLSDRLATQATVLLDDADRADEQEIVRRWAAEVPGLALEPATLGHLAVLHYTRPAG
jgi:hypothetical protein